MSVAYLLLFLTIPLLATPPKGPIELVPTPKGPEDYEHEFKGCPENSVCDQVMGHQMQRWKDLIKKLETEGPSPEKIAQALESFREKNGLPVEFYTIKKSQQGFKPLYFNSPCREHNPKNNEDQRILKGTAFIKSITKEKALVWRDQTQFEVPLGELIRPQPVLVYFGGQPEKYQLPLGDQPLYIKNKELYVLKEEDNFFYFLKVSPDGKWKVENVDSSRLGNWERKRENISCPVEKTNAQHEAFGVEFCKSVWDEDQKKAVTVKMYQGCPT